MLIDAFKTFSIYSLLEVYGPNALNLATVWNAQHVAQGFVWMPWSVGFGLLHDFGDHFVEIHLDNSIQVLPNAVRAILVPFKMQPTGEVALINCVDVCTIALPPDAYALLFEIGYIGDRVPEDLDDAAFWVRFTFVPQPEVQPAILRADEELSPTYPLLLDRE